MIQKIGALIFILIVGYNLFLNLTQGRYLISVFQYLFVGLCLGIIESLIYEKPMNDRIFGIFLWPYYVIKGIGFTTITLRK